jgi:hypothetical protein
MRGGKPKTYDASLVARASELYATGLTQVEVARAVGVTQKVIWNLMRRHNVPTRIAAKRDQAGPKNSTWGHSSVTYAAYHKRVEAAKGRPRVCEQCGSTTAEFFDWACFGRYDRVEDYKRLCRGCHHKADGRAANLLGREVAREHEADDCR